MQIIKQFKKPLIVLISIIALLLVLLINFKSVGRAPQLIKLSKSVAYPGDTITLYGNYFGGEISKGQIIINDQMVFTSNIISWSDKEITFNLHSDFKSGMIFVRNMFGESESHLITSFNDVPKIRTKEEIPGLAFIESITALKSSEDRYKISGKNFGSSQTLSYLLVASNSESEDYTEVNSNFVVSWSDDSIEFYLPYDIKGSVLYIRNSKGFSNYFNLPDRKDRSVKFNLGIYRNYKLTQRVDIIDIVALKNSSIDLFIPSPIVGINQKNLILDSESGVYNRLNSTFYHSIDVIESGEEFNLILKSSLDVYKLTTEVNRSKVKRSWDKESPNYIKGFERTPNVLITDTNIKNTAVWLARKNKNPYIQTELILNWIVKYIKLDEKGDSLSSAAFKNRKGSEEGLVALGVSMLRSAGIPSRVVKGIIIEGEKSKNYMWFEFLLPGGAWIPVDIVELKKNSVYKLGTLNYNKIAFTKGLKNIEYQKDNYDRDIYALQNTLTNFKGNIERYNTVWHNVEIE